MKKFALFLSLLLVGMGAAGMITTYNIIETKKSLLGKITIYQSNGPQGQHICAKLIEKKNPPKFFILTYHPSEKTWGNLQSNIKFIQNKKIALFCQKREKVLKNAVKLYIKEQEK